MHSVDTIGILKDIKVDDGMTFRGGNGQRKKTPQQRKKERIAELDEAFAACDFGDGKTSVEEIAEYLGKAEKTIRRYAKESEKYWVEGGQIGKK